MNILPHLDPNNDFMHLAIVDETYQQVASHVDLGTQAKIIEGEYVNLAKLVPKDKVMTNDDTRFEMRIKDGHSYWVPANNEGMAINNYSRWDDIYMRAHPTRSVELFNTITSYTLLLRVTHGTMYICMIRISDYTLPSIPTEAGLSSFNRPGQSGLRIG